MLENLDMLRCQIRYRPKGVLGKGVGNDKNASEMRQNVSCFIGKRGTFPKASKVSLRCVKNVSEMRGTPLGENTFWTVPTNHKRFAMCDWEH